MPTRPIVLAIDQGTTNSKALAVDAAGRVVARAARALAPIRTPEPGWFEQDPEDLWQATLAAVGQCLDGAGESDEVEIAGIALANQRESVVAWRASTGEPLGPALGWQDARTSQRCDALESRQPGAASLIHARTGLRLDPMFSAPKMAWLLESLGGPPAAGAGDVRIGTIDAYLIARLTGECATEAGNASRTLLFDLRTLAWDDDLLALFGLPAAVLPPVRASNAGFGTTRAGLGALPAGLGVTAVLGDSHAALYGHGLTAPGAGKVTYGTGSSVMAPVLALGATLPEPVSTTLVWLGETPFYAREGNVIATGAAVDAMAHLLRFESVGTMLALVEVAPASSGGTVGATTGLSIVPAFSGLGAPYWDRAAQPVIVGWGRDTSAADLAAAALDAVAQQVCDVVDAMRDAGDALDALHADGGASVNPALMQLQADLAGLPVLVAGVTEASALGVARLAWETLDGGTPAPWDDGGHTRIYEPRRDAAWRAAQRARWHAAVAVSRGRADRTTGRGR